MEFSIIMVDLVVAGKPYIMSLALNFQTSTKGVVL